MSATVRKTDPFRAAVFTGTFDPISLGHLDVIRRGRLLFDRLIVGIGDQEARGVNLLLATIDLLAGIAILVWPDLSLSTLAVIIGIVLVIRGLADLYVGFALRDAFKRLENSGVGA